MLDQSNISQYGRNYRLFLQLLYIIAKLPDRLSYTLSSKLANQIYSPIQQNEKKIHQAMTDANVVIGNWTALWKKYRSNHAWFCLSTFKHTALNQQWMQENVDIDSALLNQIKEEGKGALFLTYHHAFQHTLFCVLGLSGFRLQVLAAHEESTPLFPYIGKYIRKLHQDSSAHFNGGQYLFFQNNFRGVRLAKQALMNGDMLASLNDFATSGKTATYSLLNRNIPAPTGSIQLACRSGVPIIIGIMHKNGARYRVTLRRVENRNNAEFVMTSYFSFLSEILTKHPEIWEGWNWFSSLPSSPEMEHL